MSYEYHQHNNSYRRPRPTSVNYRQKLAVLKRMIVEYVHENAALVDELEEVQAKIVMRTEERKFLLRKLCEYDPLVAAEVQNAAQGGARAPNHSAEVKKSKKRPSDSSSSDRRSSVSKPRRPSVKSSKKKLIPPVPVDSNGRPTFPIELGKLTIHSLGEIIPDKLEFHSEDTVFPVGYVSTRIYGSLREPTIKCVYTCKISEKNGLPNFIIACEDGSSEIEGDTPDVCHSLLLQKINDSLSLNVVSTRPRGNEFFGLTHLTVLHLFQGMPGVRKCLNYKWTRFEVSKTAEPPKEYNDAGLSFDYLQRSINMCKYKMAPDVLQMPSDFIEGI
ncbi:transforming growth factor beta regulator 1 [Anthonomus grandis grandis]|uniref:transforming growth factor beta regulator 1 n=1 Tax=Anthonomus grandis grandis TaxID=2921223 RepID=UPI0021664B1A|nr:transforming growth factor beta regulator 1 [Anthonomus grandis grandis]